MAGVDIPVLQDYGTLDINSAVFKVTDDCNLGCGYCYRENAEPVHRRSVMSMEVVDETLSQIFQYKERMYAEHGIDRTPSLYFVFHGGEPLMIGKRGFMKILDVQRRYTDMGYVIRNSVQTNGTLIDDGFADIFRENGFRVGVSIDGPRSVQDVFRVFRDGRSSFDRTCRGIDVLNDRGIPWSAISVINREYLGKEEDMFSFFRDKGAFEVDFTPSFFYETPFSLPPDEYAQFMNTMFDIWIREEAPYEIRFFKDLLHIMGYTRNPSKDTVICELAGQCHRNVSIGSNGDFYTCECLNSLERNLLGNIMEVPIPELLAGERFRRMAAETENLHPDCMDCEFFHICKGGCYNRRLPAGSGAPRLDFHCSARKSIIGHVREVCDTMIG